MPGIAWKVLVDHIR